MRVCPLEVTDLYSTKKWDIECTGEDVRVVNDMSSGKMKQHQQQQKQSGGGTGSELSLSFLGKYLGEEITNSCL